MIRRICLADPPTGLDRDNHDPAAPYLPRHPFSDNALDAVQEY